MRPPPSSTQNAHVKIVCDRCNALNLVDNLTDFNVERFYKKHAACPKPRSLGRPFEPGFIRKMLMGVLKGYNKDHPEKEVPGGAHFGIAKRMARIIYKEARLRGLPHPAQQEGTKYVPRRYRQREIEATDQLGGEHQTWE